MSGHLPDNIAHFARALRRAGMPVGPLSVIEAVHALEAGGIASKQDFYWTLHAVFVKRREHMPIFHEAFQLFFRKRDLIEKMLQILSPVAKGAAEGKERPPAASARVSDAFFNQEPRLDEEIAPKIEIDARFTTSGRDVLRTKDFAQMSAAEIDHAKAEIARLRLPVDDIETRRFMPSNKPYAFDMRRTMNLSMRRGGQLVLPAFRKKRRVPPPIVALCDISGSMAQYTRIFLHFLHALSGKNRRVHTFLFGTRLTNVTREIANKDPDEALMAVSEAVLDWSGGTRIGEALETFNREWSRRVLGQGAIVLLITDGLERDASEGLAKQMDRLHRSCRHLLWLNPLLRYDQFQARANGIRVMLEYVDDFRAVHSIDSMAALCGVLSAPSKRANDPRTWL